MGIFDLFTGKSQSKAIKAGTQYQVDGYNLGQTHLYEGRNDLINANAPYNQLGVAGAQSYGNALGLNGAAGAAQAQSQFQSSPGYQFQLGQGVQALDNSAAAQGNLYSGQQAKDLTAYGQGLANQDYGSWLDRLQGVTQQGQSGALQGQQLNQNYQLGIAQNAIDRGTVQGNGKIQAQNAKQGAFNNLLGLGGQIIGLL